MKSCVCHKTFLKFGMWNSRTGTSCGAMYQSFTYIWVNMGIAHFQVVRSQKVLGCTAMYKTRNTGTGNRMQVTQGMGGMLYSRECHQILQGMSPNIPGNVLKHSGECCQTFRGTCQIFRGMSSNIPGNVAKYSGECHQIFWGMFSNNPENIRK